MGNIKEKRNCQNCCDCKIALFQFSWMQPQNSLFLSRSRSLCVTIKKISNKIVQKKKNQTIQQSFQLDIVSAWKAIAMSEKE